MTSKTPKKTKRKTRVERTRVGNTWTEARYFQFIRGALRQAFTRYPAKYQAKDAAKRELLEKKGRQKYEYQCAHCLQWYPDKQIEVDHKVPAGSLRCYEDLPGFVARMFCEADDLQMLCRGCHLTKTEDDKHDSTYGDT